MIQMSETLLWESWAQGKETWSDCECRESSEAPTVSLELPATKGFHSQLRWWECDCQSDSCVVRQECFLNTEHPGLVEGVSPMAGRLEQVDLGTKPLCDSTTSSSAIALQVEGAPPGPQSPVWENLHIPSHGAQRLRWPGLLSVTLSAIVLLFLITNTTISCHQHAAALRSTR